MDRMDGVGTSTMKGFWSHWTDINLFGKKCRKCYKDLDREGKAYVRYNVLYCGACAEKIIKEEMKHITSISSMLAAMKS